MSESQKDGDGGAEPVCCWLGRLLVACRGVLVLARRFCFFQHLSSSIDTLLDIELEIGK